MRSGLGHCALVALVLAGEACATPYQPGGIMGGFSEVQFAARTYEVTFKGNSYTSRPRARRFTFRRAAELTVQNGLYGFFVLNDATSVVTGPFSTPENCTTIGITISCTGGNLDVVKRPQNDIIITMVSAEEAAQLPPRVLVYDARLILSRAP